MVDELEPCDLCPAGGVAGFAVVTAQVDRRLCGDHLMSVLEVLDLFHVEHHERRLRP